MKFRLFGDLDCPDWILAEIAAFSKLSSIKFKLWCGAVMELRIKKLEWTAEKLQKLNSDGHFDKNSLKGFLAAIECIFTSATKHGCSTADLNNELLQLGLPHEHVAQVCKIYDVNKSALAVTLQSELVKFPAAHISQQLELNLELDSGVQHQTVSVVDCDLSDNSHVRIALSLDKKGCLIAELERALVKATELETA